MSRLEELIKEKFNNEIKFYELGELEDNGVLQLGRGKIISKNEINNNPGDYPVYSSSSVGDGEIGRYGKYMFDDERITWSIDGGGKFFYRNNLKYSVTNVGGWIKVLKNDIILTKYLYYSLINSWATQEYNYSKKAHPSVIRKEYIIPLPPLNVQKEIVDILDVFQKNIELNEKKYNESKKQIEWIKFHYLKNIDDAEIKTLGECCTVTKGKTPIQKAVPGDYPLVVTTSERKSCDTYQFDTPSVCVPLVSSRGHGVASLNQVFYQEGKYGLGNILCAVIPNDSEFINTKYLYYYLNFFKDTKIVSLMKGGANVALTMDSLKTVTVEVPPIKKQFEIMQKLETCDKLSNSLMNKIILVNKQYEYYRDLLLDFKEVQENV